MKKLISIVLLLVFTATLVLSGCTDTEAPVATTTEQPESDSQAAEATPEPEQPAPDSDEDITLTLWQDNGDVGLEMFTAIGELFKQEHPNVSIEIVSVPSDQFNAKCMAAITTNTSPDIFWNDWGYMIPLEQHTGGLTDLTNAIPDDEKDMIGQAVLDMGFYNGKQITYPHEVSHVGLGIRTSWLEAIGGTAPKTIDDFMELTRIFQEEDPAGTGAFGFTGYFGPGARYFLSLFVYGAGINDFIVDSAGNPSFNRPAIRDMVKFYASLYHEKLVPEDSINHGYNEMYQLIEGDRVAMFRVGDWNVAGWDELFDGDYTVVPYPTVDRNDQSTASITTMRGAAIPENAPNHEMAIAFAQFNNTYDAQQLHFDIL